ncbi:TPA: XRE family transcriptional regulator [Vibrio vulnificus]|uniref:helix-turn-helix domain-containing protein n=1 Tax=Vibrio vulnificus TaxID=672 RepID=UPI001A2B9775|nr:helix-turn-helix transcriptional regulator [Vibrio vulnificus]MCA3883094.1 helix-turn-helix transcriptional regulator [Vibrio vulnificus]MCA3949396.1 helix-turn-helix transcriptional regulator [Vibrio vulnificus]HAS8137086.1 XRE family transcriptional regulator [Vibrio vulnificus]HAS8217764.1 XRE family transcriptional regulator [Vibrio vulnificus]HAS8298637.1 XRE family transcriptional regulator [Vibrio vulnificus]
MDKQEKLKIEAHIGHEIKQLRATLGLTQNQLADQLDMEVAYLSKIERGNKPITSAQLLSLLAGCDHQIATNFINNILHKIGSNDCNN